MSWLCGIGTIFEVQGDIVRGTATRRDAPVVDKIIGDVLNDLEGEGPRR